MPEHNEIRHAYEPLRKKHNLPAFEHLDSDFELSAIEDCTFLLRRILENMAERLEGAIELLQSVLQPDTNRMVDMYECRFFTDEEKGSLFDVAKKIMLLSRTLDEARLSADERIEADTLKTVSQQWPGIKKELLPVVQKLKAAWQKTTDTHERKLGYFG